MPTRALDFLAYPRGVPCRRTPGTAWPLEALTGRLGGRRLLGAWFFGDEGVAPAARSQHHGLESHRGMLTLTKALES